MNQAQMMQQPAPEPDLDSYTDMSVGDILRRTREHYGQSLQQVEANLVIRASQLSALETGQIDQLPGRVYAIGFVRAYSEYLGLDGDKMVHLFKAQTVGKRIKPELQFPVSANESKAPNVYIIVGCLVGLVLVIAYWTIAYTPTNHVDAIPPVPEALKQSNIALLKPIAEAPSSSLLDAIAAPSSKIELVISENSWVEIKNAAGDMVIRQVLKPGDKYIVPNEDGLVLSTGNAGGIMVVIDGKEVGTLGQSTQVRRNVILAPETFVKSE